ncbi:MAG: hypothetical protein KDC98_12895 [Planctomycetes bacterium]|nr:hypothetical protein [Planctomycetota bacterium]
MSHPITRSLPALAAAAAFLLPLAAQDATAPTSGDQLDVIGRSCGLEVIDGVLCGAGATYKAAFDERGVRYTPALGREASRNFPLQFELLSIRRGAVTLFDAAATTAAAPTHESTLVRYPRGPQIVETWQVRPDGIEQAFEFAHRPDGSGDLVVRGRIVTELATEQRGRQDTGLTFTAEGIGGVSIGAVIGIDVGGARVAGGLSFDGEVVEFSLPAAFVETASYPMALDPMVGTAFLVHSTEGFFPDVAFDESLDRYFVVWEVAFSSGDSDIYGQMFSLGGALVGSTVFVTTSTFADSRPAVANGNQGDMFLCAWQRHMTSSGPWAIRARVIDGSTGALSSGVNVTLTSADAMYPDVGGEATTSSDKLMVVWQEGSQDIKARTIRTSNLFQSPTLTVSTGYPQRNPCISQCGGNDGRWLVAWERLIADWDIEAAIVDRNTNMLGPTLPVTTTTVDNHNPAVDGDGWDYVIAYSQEEPGSTGKSDVYCRRLHWNTTRVQNVTSPVAVATGFNIHQDQPAVGNLETKYVISWVNEIPGAPYYQTEIHARCFAPTTLRYAGSPQTISVPSGYEVLCNSPAIASRRSSSAVGGEDDALIVFGRTSAPFFGPYTGSILARRYEAIGVGGPVYNLGGACGNGGNNTFNGPVAVGNADLRLRVTGAGSDLLFASIQLANVTQGCGGCTYNAQNDYAFVLGSGGAGSYPLAVPNDAYFLGLDLYTQWAAFLSGATPCALIPPSAQASFSNRLHATVGN